ncbi:hypothetical protein HPP92_012942 [Vanilla planifolia]|uniref:FYVE-type domain-containing protein n=1 Tax=Vanilla planifolia TaxID=51239 RepID=A0A835QS26_VANPL|nr:hypothetical protein HPP92_012942 [Vanilla planifolia]
MGGSDVSQGSRGSAEGSKLSEKSNEKKKGFGDWMNLMKPDNLEKDHWVPDEAVSQCTSCGVAFGPFVRGHHCRNCGDIFCDKCSQGRTALSADESAQLVSFRLQAEVTQRLSNAKEANRSVAVKSHEDLARNCRHHVHLYNTKSYSFQSHVFCHPSCREEMERTRKSSSGSKSSDSSSGRKTREVACPICTVHLQVQIPNSGSETIECGVCQHPFLVSAH